MDELDDTAGGVTIGFRFHVLGRPLQRPASPLVRHDRSEDEGADQPTADEENPVEHRQPLSRYEQENHDHQIVPPVDDCAFADRIRSSVCSDYSVHGVQ